MHLNFLNDIVVLYREIKWDKERKIGNQISFLSK